MKQLFTFLFLISFCFVGYSQQNKGYHEKIKAQKVAHITEKLQLTSNEAEKFWPIYNAYDKTMHDLRWEDMQTLRRKIKNRDLSETEAKKALDSFLDIEEKMFLAKKKLATDLEKVISAKKIIRLKAAEDSFNRLLMKKLRERRGDNRNKKNHP